MQVMKDYRAVNPRVWALYAEVYGTDDAPPIARLKLDIYSQPTDTLLMHKCLKGPGMKARTMVPLMIDAYMEWPDFHDPDAETDNLVQVGGWFILVGRSVCCCA